jgi:glycosyltransferase involved in cell wall biosynthesis
MVRCKDGSLGGSLAVALEGYFARIMQYYRLIDLIITPSGFAKRKMVECGRAEGTIRVIPNFIDTSRYEPDYGDDGYIIASGRLSPEKGFDVLLAAMNRLPGTRLVIAGEGPCRAELERQAVKLGLANAELIGYIARERLLALVARARFVVMPSVCLENFPYSVLEAFALGKPVIASRMGGMPEMVVDGVTGLLVDPGDPAALAEKIADLEHDADLVREMGVKARGRAEMEYNSDAHYRGIRQAYDDAGR